MQTALQVMQQNCALYQASHLRPLHPPNVNELNMALSLKPILFATSLALAANAIAQTEPGLLGLTLGQKLDVPECPKSGPGVQIPPICASYLRAASWRDGPMADVFQVFLDLEHRPTWAGDFRVTLVNGAIVEFTLATLGNAVQVDAYDAVVTKLGRPDKSSTRDWEHKRWGHVKSISATWQRPGWQASFEGLDANLDSGTLQLSVRKEPTRRPSAPL